MRYGQLQSNDRIIRSERQIENIQDEVKRLALELLQLKDEFRDETKRLLFMIDDLEERVHDA